MTDQLPSPANSSGDNVQVEAAHPQGNASPNLTLNPVRQGIAEVWVDFAGLVAVLSLGSGLIMTAGAWFPLLDAVNQFAPFLFVGTIVALLIALTTAKRSKLTLAIALIAACLAGARVVPEVASAGLQQFNNRAIPADATVVTVVTFNMHGSKITDPNRIAQWIDAQEPDFALLQEVHGAGDAVMRQLSDRLPHHVQCRSETKFCLGVIISRFPANTTTPDPASAQSRWADGRFSLPNSVEVGLVSAHTAWAIDRPLRLPIPKATSQVNQFGRIARQVRALGPDSTILTGDFNSGGWSFGLQRLERDSGLIRHSRALFSWPAVTVWRGHPRFPIVPIDHMMAGKHWRLVSIKRGPALGSDHYPLVAKFAWVGPRPSSSSRIQPNVEARR
jgi:endonuclease/exonuclease/phosphatase (EEP) superfamily protein YafD